ncbi:MAG: hydratase [Chloroflexi bacterium]|nr:hydratase [Chloroflexota bacterium]
MPEPSTPSTPPALDDPASLLVEAWHARSRIDALPDHVRPRTRADGYEIQRAVVAKSGEAAFGWKIAATSVAGQQHIGVSGPLAGRILASRFQPNGSLAPLRGNAMRVAEAEFGFRIARDLRGTSAGPLMAAEVMAAVGFAFPAIELPDSRYRDFVVAGEAQLIADLACAGIVITGPETATGWSRDGLANHRVSAYRNGELVAEGTGANALGDPCVALAWLANELIAHGSFLAAGDIVITGTCVVPVPLTEHDHVTVDFGTLGRASVVLTD